ncbi:MAG: S-layer homology domain-containing protein, partial [Clostridiales bacterium]|nr:S-layer homology domain-containing protein [Clostridiales bacterium]
MGLLKGDQNGDLNEDVALTRAEMMVVLARLYGVEDEAMAFPLPSTFTDVAVDAWYAPYVAYAQLEGWTVGYGDGTFGPEDAVTEQMVATFMLRALGY